MDSELNSVSQNSPFFTPMCKVQVWATIGQGDRTPTDQVVKIPEHSLFSLSHSTPSTPSTSDLQGLLSTSPHGAACFQDLFFWVQKAVESCKLHWQQAQRTSPHCSTQGPANLRIWGTPSRLAPSCYPYKGKEHPVSSSADFHQTLHSKNSFIQHWSPNFLLQPPAPSLQRLVMLNWA